MKLNKEKLGDKLGRLAKGVGQDCEKVIDKEKADGFSTRAIKLTSDTGKKVINSVKTAAENYNNQKQIMDYEAKIRKYNPLFPEKYDSPDFNKPNLVIIVDDAVRKGIDVCENAIGWLSNQKGVEVLHLYDEAVLYSRLQFIPAAVCDCAYYVDPHDRNKFISIDTYFSNAQEEKLAELQHIAYSLGAKEYQVEMVEFNEESGVENTKGNMSAFRLKASVNTENSHTTSSKCQALATATFSGNRVPQMPALCWFKYDKNVQNLIAMRCSENLKNDITEYTIELSNSNSASMSLSTANKVDVAIKNMGLSCNFDRKSKEEHLRKLIFKVSF